ncbi:MAG: DsbA family protein [Anaerolineaceae bacterium]|nr:DsbA family protein [Anaerolineaceae bacterium]
MGKRQAIKAKRKRDNLVKQFLTIFGIIIVAVFIVGILIYPSIKINNANQDLTIPDTVGTYDSIDMGLGDPNAPVTVEIFSDFQCPACGTFASSEEHNFVEKYVTTGQVFYVFRPFNFLGQESLYAAEAAYCAVEQGDFWSFHDVLYNNLIGENTGTINDKRLIAYAEAAGLNGDDFTACLESDTYIDQYMIDNDYARESGVNATPSFKIGDQVVSYSDLIPLLEEALAK